ncbi:MAG: hypothetical protein R6V58_12445 [Planctomycetota bacterium]
MADAKRNRRFLVSSQEGRRGPDDGSALLARGEFSRRVRNEKVASVLKRFLIARVAFDAIVEMFRSPEPMRFEPINTFVERTLFGLKEECHALFRKTDRPAGDVLYAEDLFDVLTGSIFHEMMKIKENCYILEHYGPTYRSMAEIAERRIRVPVYERLFFRACKRIIERASTAVYDDIRSAEQLFQDATEHLLNMLPRFAHNGLATRMLIENKQLVEMVYGEDSLNSVLETMYEGHLDNAYLHAASSYLDAGRSDEAKSFCRKSLAENPDNFGARRLLDQLERAR